MERRPRPGWITLRWATRKPSPPSTSTPSGGLPFLQMAVPELRSRQPGMMMLISLAISVAFFYSLAALFLPAGEAFFWELTTLIDIMLLGHWLEMRSVRQASGALNELARLMPDTAERLLADGSVESGPGSRLKVDERV